jgi:hypothetical protein
VRSKASAVLEKQGPIGGKNITSPLKIRRASNPSDRFDDYK